MMGSFERRAGSQMALFIPPSQVKIQTSVFQRERKGKKREEKKKSE